MNLNPFSDDRDIMKIAPIPARIQRPERVVMITGDNVEDMEFFYPYYRLSEEGYMVDVATVTGEPFKGKHGYQFKQTKKLADLTPFNYALMYLPGGKAPAKLMEDESVLQFVREFATTGRPIAAVCHGPQILAKAGLISGRKITGYDGIKDEIEKAGAHYSDEALAIDGQFITSRLPGDLHRHLCGVIDVLQGREHKLKAA